MPNNKAKREWDREHLTVVGCRIKKDKAEVFRQACKQLGTVPNQVLMKAVDETIEKAGLSDGDQA